MEDKLTITMETANAIYYIIGFFIAGGFIGGLIGSFISCCSLYFIAWIENIRKTKDLLKAGA
jgi:hypothetical protein